MYHFNGLETAAAPPRLARFTIQRRSTSGLIGQPVPIDADVGVAYSGSYNCPMEQVSCRAVILLTMPLCDYLRYM